MFNVAWGNICYNWWAGKTVNIESTELYPKKDENKAIGESLCKIPIIYYGRRILPYYAVCAVFVYGEHHAGC